MRVPPSPQIISDLSTIFVSHDRSPLSYLFSTPSPTHDLVRSNLTLFKVVLFDLRLTLFFVLSTVLQHHPGPHICETMLVQFNLGCFCSVLYW